MEGYHWGSVASPNETPIVTSLIHPPPPDIPSPLYGRILVWSPLFSSLIPPSVKGLCGGWQGRSGAAGEKAFCPWISACG